MCTDFEFDNRRLSDFGCVMCHINTESGLKSIDIGCNITFTTVKNNHTSVHSATSSSYESVYTTTFDIMKYNCNTGSDDIYMNSLEVRNLLKWLNRHGYYKFKIFNDISFDSDIYYYGSFNAEQIMIGNNIVGLSLTFTSNAPYGFGENVELSFMNLNADDEFEIIGDSDKYGVIYPIITIKNLSNEDNKTIEILNKTTNNKVQLKNCYKNEIITIDGNIKYPMTNNKDHELTLPNDFNYEYFDILVDEFDTINLYKVSSPCEIIVNYYPIRKVGVY